MADPYQQQPSWPRQPTPSAPQRSKRKDRTPLIVIWLVAGALVLGLVIAVAAVLAGRSDPAAPQPAISPSVDPSMARPGIDMGAGTPGAPCATNRLGKYFVKDGVTYTCKGPKPYSWQP
ncbi:hypothetical protein [Dactylosporangium sp. CA-092794]|uniref:hypothetical protein n=1 Tax=Dactylosporangium sp. CA-092794 TaxID=3239929 RepID=UPI003D8D04A6